MSASTTPPGRGARCAVRRHVSGVLSTHSVRFSGYPYGSALPHMTDAAGCPVILISHLAEHTHNIEANARVGYLVAESGPQLQAAGRASLLGTAIPVEDDQVRERYLRYHPEGQRNLEIGGFRFFRIVPLHVRYIEGFGHIRWVAADQYLASEVPLDAAASDILQHMNEDHADTLVQYCRHAHGVEPGSAQMIGIDLDGFDVRADEQILRFDFDQPVTTPGAARDALVRLAQRARS